MLRKCIYLFIPVFLSLVSFICLEAKAASVYDTPNDSAKPAPVAVTRVWNIQNADIREIIPEIAAVTGKTFILDPKVEGKISLISQQPLNQEALYQLFLSALQLLGFAAIDTGHAIKIEPTNQAIHNTTKFASDNAPGVGDELVTRLVPVENANAEQVVNILVPMLPAWGQAQTYRPGNAIILSGRAGSVNKLVALIRKIDAASEDNLQMLSLQHANATEVVTILKKLYPENVQTAHQAHFVADVRHNTILLSGDPVARLRVQALIARLDKIDLQTDEDDATVVDLHYLKAKKFAPMLNKILQAQLRIYNQAQEQKIGVTKIAGYVQAEEDTNALIITGPSSLIHSLTKITEHLDVRPAQVLVQAIIVELDIGDSSRLGVQWNYINDDHHSHEHAHDNGDLSLGDLPSADNSLLNDGFLTGIGFIRKGSLSALITAIQGFSGANVLSTPSIVVLNNVKAKLSIGKEISIQTSQTGPVATTTINNIPNTISTFTQQMVGLELNVTPQINRGNAVQLSIEQKDGTLQNPENLSTTPVINRSDIHTSVMVDNGDILVLGGLISSSLTKSSSKIPILGDVPLLGHLFRVDSHKFERKKLMVFIKPIILHDPLTGTHITEKNYQMIRNAQAHWSLRGKNSQTLDAMPEWPRLDESYYLPQPFNRKSS